MPLISSGSTAPGSFSTLTSEKDPYQYQVGFGNEHVSEALPGTLPQGQNMPQKNKYDLYTEVMTGSAFVAPRAENLHSILYRIRPSVAHKGYTRLPDNQDLESNFLPSNSKVHISPTQLAWRPFDLPPDSEKVDFIDGIKTLAGNGEPTLREGLAISMYLANTSMGKKAFCNNDGDMLMIPQQGRLDIQTEFGRMMVRPGEICVIQRGIKFKVMLPDGPSRGYLEELYGSHWELPELGSVGSHGMANSRDFQFPLANFDIDQSEWHIVYKLGGQLHRCVQENTPFDVVAWHGTYVPYKYDLDKFIYFGSISRDHIDPSCYVVLTAKSKQPGVPLTDFLVIGERWDVASGTFRPPYFHRNANCEFIGLICGVYEGRSDEFLPGGASFEAGFCPHGISTEVFQAASEAKLEPMRISAGTTLIVLETGVPLTITDFAMNRSGKLHEHDPKMWDGLKPNFMNHIDQINKDLKALGRPELGAEMNYFHGN